MGASSVVRPLRTVTVVVLVAAGLSLVGVARASAAPCQSWGVQPPDVGTSTNELSAVTATSACNAWAVGGYFNGTWDQTLIERWNGTAWKIQASPDPGGSANQLNGVAATSRTNAWAVGYYLNGAVAQTLIEHWNGRAWKVQRSPNPGGSSTPDELDGVAAVSPTDVWAVGESNEDKTLIEHWNGRTWKAVHSPTPGSSGRTNGIGLSAVNIGLRGVVASSSSSAWAVGDYFNGTANQTLIEHWNGRSWKVQRSRNPGGSGNDHALSGVAAVSPRDAWAVGIVSNGTFEQTLIEHWNGRRWKVQPSPSPGGSGNPNLLAGVAAASPSDAWAVGSYSTGPPDQTLIEHWNGKAWKVQASPILGTTSGLSGVAAISPSNAWAVGFYYKSTADQALALHCC